MDSRREQESPARLNSNSALVTIGQTCCTYAVLGPNSARATSATTDSNGASVWNGSLKCGSLEVQIIDRIDRYLSRIGLAAKYGQGVWWSIRVSGFKW